MPRPTVLSPNSADEYIAIRNFMVAEGGLGLGNAASRVYALIYQFSIDNAGCFYGSLNYLAARTGIGRRSAVRALKELVDDGLVKEVGYYRRGDNQNTKKYVADVEKADAARRAPDPPILFGTRGDSDEALACHHRLMSGPRRGRAMRRV